ncbi:hypothetical protein FB45DRAFT_1066410 [Roridomyces roridus]|uniref:F-box domain-containing protein n=1 Tax=Roridomyces roridus TaxID=1738132 RepID=A0AAD7B4D6_9AGAR|nr:hypothetical protein FB45DRAFT_1066410 [Roridomyces roridus]
MSDDPARSQTPHRASIQSEEPGHCPVETIPAEIIREILLHSLPAHGVQPSRSLVLAQICGRWREIALGTVELWSSVDLTLRATSSDASSPGIIQLLHILCRRAKSHPLSLTVRCPRARADLPRGLLALVKQYAPQMTSLALSVPLKHWDEFVHLYSVHFPSLRHLSLHISAMGDPLARTQTFPAFDGMPQLEELHIHPMSNFASLRLRSKTLTTFEFMGPISLTEVEQIFLSLPNLRHLTLRNGWNERLLPVTASPPPLESLSVGAAFFLDAVTLPHLHRLELPLHTSITTLRNFIALSGCILLELSVRVAPDFDDTALIEICQAVPWLTSLRLDLTANCGIRALYSILQSNHDILPALRELAVIESVHPDGEAPPAYDYDAVASMLCTRRSELKSFVLTLKPKYRSSRRPNELWLPYGVHAARMIHLREYGLDVRVRVTFTGIQTVYWASGGGTTMRSPSLFLLVQTRSSGFFLSYYSAHVFLNLEDVHQLKTFSLTLKPNYYGVRVDSLIPSGAPAAEMMRLREDGLDIRVRVTLTGNPTVYWPSGGDDDEAPPRVSGL